MWNELARSPKHQHLTTLQRYLDDTAQHISVHAPTFATPGLLKLTLILGFLLYHHNDLGMGLHHFGIGQHTSAAWKMLKASIRSSRVAVPHLPLLTLPR